MYSICFFVLYISSFTSILHVHITDCPVSGQIRKPCALAESCTRTCKNIHKTISCHRICKPYGCQCPNGTVLNNDTKQCVKPDECPTTVTDDDKGKIFDYNVSVVLLFVIEG